LASDTKAIQTGGVERADQAVDKIANDSNIATIKAAKKSEYS